MGRGKNADQNISTKRRWRVAEQGADSTAICEKSAWELVVHLSDQWVCRHLLPLAQAESNTRPRLAVPGPLASTPRLAHLYGVLLAAPALQNEAYRNREKKLGQEAQSQLNTLQHCTSVTLLYLESSLPQSCLTLITLLTRKFLHHLLCSLANP